jgi:signal transduction histidine kinase
VSVRRPSKVDVAASVLVGVAIAVEASFASRAHASWPASAAVCLLFLVPLAWLRRSPLPAAAGIFALALVESAFLTPLPTLVTSLALVLLPAFAVAFVPSLRDALAGAVLCLVGGGLLELVTPAGDRDLSRLLPGVALMALAWTAGRVAQARQARVRELEEIEERLQAARAGRERQAIAEERGHIARELHDVVGHALTVICLQAGAARRVWPDDPVMGARALADLGSIARETLVQLRSSLALIDPDAPDTRLGLADLESLADGARAAGLRVSVDVVGVIRALPSRHGLVAYRVIQESLTNTARHAGPTDVHVRLAYEPEAVEVEVIDRGRANDRSPALASGGGNGLRGMRERVESCAGVLAYGPMAAGGYAVRARLPVSGPA